jgi:hypothetical protein
MNWKCGSSCTALLCKNEALSSNPGLTTHTYMHAHQNGQQALHGNLREVGEDFVRLSVSVLFIQPEGSRFY